MVHTPYEGTHLFKSAKMEYFNELEKLLSSLETDANKFFNKNNKTAGTRVCRGMLGVKALAQAIRKEVLELKNKKMERKGVF